MFIPLYKKILPITLCLTVCLGALSGCTKKTEDEYYWTSRWEEEQVWVEYENTQSDNLQSNQDPNNYGSVDIQSNYVDSSSIESSFPESDLQSSGMDSGDTQSNSNFSSQETNSSSVNTSTNNSSDDLKDNESTNSSQKPSDGSSNNGSVNSSQKPSNNSSKNEASDKDSTDSSKKPSKNESSNNSSSTNSSQKPSNNNSSTTSSQKPSNNSSNNNSSNKNEESSKDETSSNSGGIDTNAKVDPADKPKVKNTASLLSPFTTKSDAEAEIMRDKVLNSKSEKVDVEGTVYYISYRGNDDNDGLSPQTPWKTLTKLSYSLNIKSGDAVLFERGGVYRGGVACKSGVYYGAYGEGDKPALYRSSSNYAKTKWNEDSENIWVAPGIVSDAGVIVFNHGELAGKRKFSKEELKQNGDYYSAEGGRVFVYMDKQPAEKFTSIEIGGDKHVFSISSGVNDVTIDNFTIKYTGAMGVQAGGNNKNITVTNCEIGWIGGSVLNGYGEGNVRYGNGIEFWNGCENVRVENNWIYQVYDSGFTHQGNGTNGFTVKNVLCTKNLIEYCNFGSIEYWAPAENKHKMVDVEYSYNILRFAGYGWDYSGQPATHIYSTDNYNEAENFVIKNNILDTALNRHVRCVHHGGTLPKMSDNTFIGKRGDRLGSIGKSTTSTTYFFEDSTQSAIRADWLDSTAKILFND